jgi:hypothetical protein
MHHKQHTHALVVVVAAMPDAAVAEHALRTVWAPVLDRTAAETRRWGTAGMSSALSSTAARSWIEAPWQHLHLAEDSHGGADDGASMPAAASKRTRTISDGLPTELPLPLRLVAPPDVAVAWTALPFAATALDPAHDAVAGVARFGTTSAHGWL